MGKPKPNVPKVEVKKPAKKRAKKVEVKIPGFDPKTAEVYICPGCGSKSWAQFKLGRCVSCLIDEGGPFKEGKPKPTKKRVMPRYEITSKVVPPPKSGGAKKTSPKKSPPLVVTKPKAGKRGNKVLGE